MYTCHACDIHPCLEKYRPRYGRSLPLIILAYKNKYYIMAITLVIQHMVEADNSCDRITRTAILTYRMNENFHYITTIIDSQQTTNN